MAKKYKHFPRGTAYLLAALSALLFHAGLPTSTLAQLPVFECPVFWQGQPLANPFQGGLNAPQFNEADLNHDGIEDLIVFDRAGDLILTYLRIDQGGGQKAFELAREYASYFPAYTDWGLLRDYDQDGIKDLFTWSGNPAINGLRVFRGRYQQDTLTFDPYPVAGSLENVLLFPLQNGTKTQIYVAFDDIPAIDDLDNDGDLDLLTFSPGGGYAEWYKNLSVESGFGADSLEFILVDNCWGKFYESGLGAQVELSPDPGECSLGFQGDQPAAEIRHAGSTLLTLDTDNDGDKELLLGDISFANINRLVNGGTPNQAWITAQDTFFPAYDEPIDISIFPAVFSVDMDHDGIVDLVAAPNSDSGSQDTANVWFYKNLGTNEVPQFALQNTEHLVNEMIDLGTGARPVFLDVDADGLQDMLVGNYGFFTPGVLISPALILFKNTGTLTDPAFTLVDLDYQGLSAFGANNIFGFAPAVGDLDQDGDTDLLIGEFNGRLIYLENEAGPGNPVDFAAPVPNWQDIGIGSFSMPSIADINTDGLPDLLIGEKIGNVNYFQNQGTPGNPIFDPDPSMAPNASIYGKIDMRTKGFLSGYSSPVFFRTPQGPQLLVGSNFGAIRHYDVLSDPNEAFPVLDSLYTGYRDGFRTNPGLVDIDEDGLYEIFVGNQRGGLTAYQTDFQVAPTSLEPNLPLTNKVAVAYDPSQRQILLENRSDRILQASMVDLQGRTVFQTTVVPGTSRWPVSHLPDGAYFVHSWEAGNPGVTTKLVIY